MKTFKGILALCFLIQSCNTLCMDPVKALALGGAAIGGLVGYNHTESTLDKELRQEGVPAALMPIASPLMKLFIYATADPSIPEDAESIAACQKPRKKAFLNTAVGIAVGGLVGTGIGFVIRK